jgi:spoIIIJ-associated protein
MARPASVERHARDGRHLPATVRARFEGLRQAPTEIERIAQRWLDAIFALAGLDLECEIRRSAEQLEIEVFGKDREALVEDEGEMITAIQHLMPRLLTVELGETVGVRIDSNGMRELREEELRRRAQEAAREVRSTGEVVVLEPLPPADRRIVHLAVADDATVATESVGRGFFRRVTIRPA